MISQIDWVMIILIFGAFGLTILGMIDKMIRNHTLRMKAFYESILDSNHEILKEFDKIHNMFSSIESDLNILLNKELEKKAKLRKTPNKISDDAD